jgi:hypothetical protein
MAHDKHPELVPIVPPRDLSADERAALDFLLSQEFHGSAQLRRQAQIAKVASKCACCADIWFTFDRNNVEAANLRDSVPVTANLTDEDGMFLEVFVYTEGGYLASLEIWRGDLQPNPNFPDLKESKVSMRNPLELS